MSTDNKFQEMQIPSEIEHLTRQKVVRELHDGLTQTVSALAMRINFARRLIATDPDAASDELEKVEGLTREATKEIRHIIFLLRPMEQGSFELPSAFEALADKMHSLFNIEISLDIEQDLANQLTLIDQLVIYSMVEEAVDSARKRNWSSHLSVILNKPGRQLVQITIEDRADFAGQIEKPFQGQELESIQNYASLVDGSVVVESDGMLIRILFPLTPSGDAE